MKHALALVVGALFLASCGGGYGYSTPGSIDDVFVEVERAPVRSGGWCDECNMNVYSGHRCGITSPCTMCGREKGARHLHETSWVCPVDSVVTSKQHECNDAKTCFTCRADRQDKLGTRGCKQCLTQAWPREIVGITSYCGTCNLEVGANHICGATIFCRKCLRESGKGHIHEYTRLCFSHATEHDPDHICGTTAYCRKCHRDAGEDHVHGVTEFCFKCGVETEWPHAYH